MVEFDTDFPRISDEHLKQFVIDVFTSYGMRDWDAEISAEILVESDLRGIDSHGVPRMAFYVERLKRGGFNLEAELEVVSESAAAIRFDANNGFGPPMAYKAMERCIEKAQRSRRLSGVSRPLQPLRHRWLLRDDGVGEAWHGRHLDDERYATARPDLRQSRLALDRSDSGCLPGRRRSDPSSSTARRPPSPGARSRLPDATRRRSRLAGPSTMKARMSPILSTRQP